MNTQADSNHVIGILAHSPVYQDYERAFNETTGLPINLRPVEAGNSRTMGGGTRTPSAR